MCTRGQEVDTITPKRFNLNKTEGIKLPSKMARERGGFKQESLPVVTFARWRTAVRLREPVLGVPSVAGHSLDGHGPPSSVFPDWSFQGYLFPRQGYTSCSDRKEGGTP